MDTTKILGVIKGGARGIGLLSRPARPCAKLRLAGA